MDSDSEFDSAEGSDCSLSDYIDIDINHAVGQAIAVWTYTKPESLALFTPSADDTLYRAVRYAEDRLGFDRRDEKILVLSPGDKIPHEITNIYNIRPGSVVMVVQKHNLHLKVEINQLKAKFSMSADPFATVYDIKAYIKKIKGIPIDQQDILFRDKSLENSHRLYEYRIHDGTIMHVLIQVHFDFLVNIETFWGQTYRLYVDRCSTGSDIIYTVFGRTFSKYGPDQVLVHELYVPVHVLILQHQKHSIHWDYCLGYFGIKNGDTIELNTVGQKSQLNMQTIKVVSESGEFFEVEVSQFDRWSVVAFMLHGHTGVPVDLIRLYIDKVQVDFNSVVGEVNKKHPVIMNVLVTHVDEDLMFGIPLQIGLGHGILENIKLSPVKTVKDVKNRLESIGVPNATMYELVIGDTKLPNNAKLKDVIHDLNVPLSLQVEKFPVFIHAPDRVIYKTMVDVNDTFRDLKHKIELKSGHAISNCRILISGQEYKQPNDTKLYKHGFSTRTSVFVETSNFMETFFITRGHLLVKLKIPIKPKAEEIKKSIWNSDDIPEGCLTCLQTFFFWFFSPRVTKKYMLPRKKKSKKLLPAANHPLQQMIERKPAKPKLKKIEERKAIFEDEDKWFAEGAKTFKGGDKVYVDTKRKYSPKKVAEPEIRTRPDGQQSPPWPQTERYVQSWLDQSQSEPKTTSNDRQSPQRVTVPLRLNVPKTPKKAKPASEVQHMMPRWWKNLYQRNDENRLLMGNETAVVGSNNPRNLPNPSFSGDSMYVSPLKYPSKSVSTKTQNQGDAYMTKYFQRKVYDKHPVMYGGTDEDKAGGSSPSYDTYRTTKAFRKHRQSFHKQAIP